MLLVAAAFAIAATTAAKARRRLRACNEIEDYFDTVRGGASRVTGSLYQISSGFEARAMRNARQRSWCTALVVAPLVLASGTTVFSPRLAIAALVLGANLALVYVAALRHVGADLGHALGSDRYRAFAVAAAASFARFASPDSPAAAPSGRITRHAR